AWRGTSRPSREQLLADWRGLATDAAACAIAAGQPDRAVELLEQGRGGLWSQLLETRTDLTALHESHSCLAARLDAVRANLDRPVTAPGDADDPASPTPSAEADTQRRGRHADGAGPSMGRPHRPGT